jgi:hypothetical protein
MLCAKWFAQRDEGTNKGMAKLVCGECERCDEPSSRIAEPVWCTPESASACPNRDSDHVPIGVIEQTLRSRLRVSDAKRVLRRSPRSIPTTRYLSSSVIVVAPTGSNRSPLTNAQSKRKSQLFHDVSTKHGIAFYRQ